MGIVVYTMSELIMKLKQARKEVNSKYYEYLDPDSNKANNSRLFYTLYNIQTARTVNGKIIGEVGKEIQNIFTSLRDTINVMIKLQHIKNAVNNSCLIEIPDIFELYFDGNNTNTYTIDDLVTFKSPQVKNYYLNLVNKLKKDKEYAEAYLENHEKNLEADTMKYVLTNAKPVSLSDETNKDHYIDLMMNYRKANELTLINPTGVDPLKFEESVIKFYNIIDYKLMEFNNNTTVRIDFSLPTNYWKFEHCDYKTISTPNSDINSL